MNKVTKGTLAAAAAGALLLGGVGTYATWSDTRTINAGTVTSGHLNLTTGTPGGWFYSGDTVATPSPVIVPGDTLTNTYSVTIDATGDNMKGNLAIAGYTPATGSDITVGISPAGTLPAGVTASGSTISFAAAGTYTFNVSVTVTAGANAVEDGTLDLTALGLTLSQNA